MTAIGTLVSKQSFLGSAREFLGSAREFLGSAREMPDRCPPTSAKMPVKSSDLTQTLLPKKWSRNQPKAFFFRRKGIWDETGRAWDETGKIGDEWAAAGTNGQRLG